MSGRQPGLLTDREVSDVRALTHDRRRLVQRVEQIVADHLDAERVEVAARLEAVPIAIEGTRVQYVRRDKVLAAQTTLLEGLAGIREHIVDRLTDPPHRAPLTGLSPEPPQFQRFGVGMVPGTEGDQP